MPKVFRKERIEAEILRVMADAIANWKEPPIPKELISFTRVELSRDKRHAKVFVSVFDPEKGEEPSNHALSELWKIYKPDLWFFGHWHQYLEVKMMGTQCYCLSAPGLGGRWWMWLPERR